MNETFAEGDHGPPQAFDEFLRGQVEVGTKFVQAAEGRHILVAEQVVVITRLHVALPLAVLGAALHGLGVAVSVAVVQLDVDVL